MTSYDVASTIHQSLVPGDQHTYHDVDLVPWVGTVG